MDVSCVAAVVEGKGGDGVVDSFDHGMFRSFTVCTFWTERCRATLKMDGRWQRQDLKV